MAEAESPLTLRLDAELQRRAQEAADRLGLTLGAWVEQAMRDQLAAGVGGEGGVSGDSPSSPGAPFADAASATRDTRSSAG